MEVEIDACCHYGDDLSLVSFACVMLDVNLIMTRMMCILCRLRNIQNAGSRRGGGGYRNNMGNNLALFRPVSEDDLNRDNEYTPLLNKLNTLREVISCVEHNYMVVCHRFQCIFMDGIKAYFAYHIMSLFYRSGKNL